MILDRLVFVHEPLPYFFINLIRVKFILSPVSLAPLINIHSRISPRIFEQIRNVIMRYTGARGTLIHDKKLEADKTLKIVEIVK
jgi:hypothetical protein